MVGELRLILMRKLLLCVALSTFSFSSAWASDSNQVQQMSASAPEQQEAAPLLAQGPSLTRRLRSACWGELGYLVTGLYLGGGVMGGATVEYLFHPHFVFGGYISGGYTRGGIYDAVGDASNVGTVAGGPLLRLRFPFGQSSVAWLITLQGGVGGFFTESLKEVVGVITVSWIGVEWFFNEHMGMTFQVPGHIAYSKNFVAVGTGLAVGFIYAW